MEQAAEACGVRKVDPAGNRGVLGRDSVYAPYAGDIALIITSE